MPVSINVIRNNIDYKYNVYFSPTYSGIMRITLSVCFFIFGLFTCYGQKPDTFHVYFPLNEKKVSRQAATYIDNLLFNDVLFRGQKLIILGYADYRGNKGYNETLSAARARNVQDYLVKSGLDKADIKLCLGKGKIDRAPVAGSDGVPADRKVQIVIERNTSEHTSETTSSKKRGRDSVLIPSLNLKVNTTYPLDILFENSSSMMLTKSAHTLQQLYDFMDKNKTVRIQIEGHICCMDPGQRGDGVDSRGGGPLSWKRAQAIYNYLVQQGIKKERLSYVGLGNSAPSRYPEVTELDKEQNRRVEIRILSK